MYYLVLLSVAAAYALLIRLPRIPSCSDMAHIFFNTRKCFSFFTANLIFGANGAAFMFAGNGDCP
jgi:hypothetical protein